MRDTRRLSTSPSSSHSRVPITSFRRRSIKAGNTQAQSIIPLLNAFCLRSFFFSLSLSRIIRARHFPLTAHITCCCWANVNVRIILRNNVITQTHNCGGFCVLSARVPQYVAAAACPPAHAVLTSRCGRCGGCSLLPSPVCYCRGCCCCSCRQTRAMPHLYLGGMCRERNSKTCARASERCDRTPHMLEQLYMYNIMLYILNRQRHTAWVRCVLCVCVFCESRILFAQFHAM